MRIYGSNGAAPVASPNVVRRQSGGAFSLEEPETTRGAAASGTPRTVSGIDALIALQGVEEPLQRRRRALTRGKYALDVLDELKIGLLAGSLDADTLGKLRQAAAGLKDASGDSQLDGILAEVELRVEVELAKMGAG
ncbi:MAG: flagellar assembly protein FliX [Proteobacteria bacterium]|nr:flagellar assembly protein FliX [Pseudomonadota bacterium]